MSYCKIIEIRNPEGSDVRKWIKRNFTLAQADPQFARVAGAFDKMRVTTTPEDYLWKYRLATAHASVKMKSDPDDGGEINRLSIAADVFQIFARIFVSKDLGVSVSQYSGD